MFNIAPFVVLNMALQSSRNLQRQRQEDDEKRRKRMEEEINESNDKPTYEG